MAEFDFAAPDAALEDNGLGQGTRLRRAEVAPPPPPAMRTALAEPPVSAPATAVASPPADAVAAPPVAYDRALSRAAARRAMRLNPAARAQILARLEENGIATTGV